MLIFQGFFVNNYINIPTLTASMKTALSDLALERLWVVYPGNKSYSLTKKVSVLSVREIAGTWKY
jgi:hypothetical protein